MLSSPEHHKNSRAKDANDLRKRISIDQEGKPILKDNSSKVSPSNFKAASFKE